MNTSSGSGHKIAWDSQAHDTQSADVERSISCPRQLSYGRGRAQHLALPCGIHTFPFLRHRGWAKSHTTLFGVSRRYSRAHPTLPATGAREGCPSRTRTHAEDVQRGARDGGEARGSTAFVPGPRGLPLGAGMAGKCSGARGRGLHGACARTAVERRVWEGHAHTHTRCTHAHAHAHTRGAMFTGPWRWLQRKRRRRRGRRGRRGWTRGKPT